MINQKFQKLFDMAVQYTCERKNGDVRLAWIRTVHSCSVTASTRVGKNWEALFTKTSSLPHTPTASVMTRWAVLLTSNDRSACTSTAEFCRSLYEEKRL